MTEFFHIYRHKASGEFTFVPSESAPVNRDAALEYFGTRSIADLRQLRSALTEFFDARPLPELPDLSETPIAALAGLWRQFKDKITASNSAAAKREAKLKIPLEAIAAELNIRMNAEGVKSIRIEGIGTVKREKKTRNTVADWNAYYDFLWAKGTALVKEGRSPNEIFGWLYKRVNNEPITAHLEEAKVAPPGVNSSSEYEVSVIRN